jgi:predicted amidohydrolase YtcJ
MKRVLCVLATILAPTASGVALAQPADTVLVQGKIVTLAAKSTVAEALAIRDGRIVAVGAFAKVKPLITSKTHVIDLQGRTVVPGLIDSHMHAIRAALSFATEVNWIGAKSIPEALARLTESAKKAKPGNWLIVAGGWTPEQFVEKRAPIQDELVDAAPDNPVYIQLFYRWAMLTPSGFAALAIREDKDVPPISPAEWPATRRPSPRSSRGCPSPPSKNRSRARRSFSRSSTA